MGDELCVEEPVVQETCYEPPRIEAGPELPAYSDPDVEYCGPTDDALPPVNDQSLMPPPTPEETVERLRDLQGKYGDPDADAGKQAIDAMNQLPPEQKLEAIDQMDRDEVEQFANHIPPERRTELRDMAEKCTDPEKKLQLWAKYHAGQAASDAEAANGGATDLKATRRTEAAAGTDAEMTEEVNHLRDKALAEGRDVTMDEVNELVARKEKEHELEMKYNVNLTNDGDDALARYAGTAQEKRGRKVWTKEELDLMEPELARLSDDQRAVVTDFRRADVHYKADGTTKDGGVAAHARPDGEIEVFGDLVKTDPSDPTKKSLKQSGIMVHEIGHVIDNKMPEQDELEVAADFKSFGSKADMETQIGAAKMAELEAAPKVGNNAQQAVTIDGVVYERVVDAHGDAKYKSYNADALPNPEYTERTTDGWHDEWDYARTNTDDMFADQFKLAARDPIRSHTDLIDGPQREVDDLEARLAAETTAGAPTPETTAKLEEAKKRKETLASQYEKMRNFNGVDDATIAMAGDDLDADQYAAFQDQAQYAQTPGQLAELAQLHRDGKAVDETAVADKVSALPPTLSVDDRAAFEQDAKKCFTPAQLDKLYESYKTGKRKATRSGDSNTLRGTWDTSQISGEDSLLGT
ncbi:MAG: hypothetical protein KF773_23630 [Deltaproteobacteria bacterium]|nr:hypothetical protein [Deltaproteobacteria bacterium]MCW5803992.1 hypothetical protein [Deltaproteobacteria bacterium]